jgi:lysyl-tRNA synthetase class 2
MPMMNYTHTQTLKDVELRFQKRYLDFICNETVKDTFIKRAKIIRTMRSFLETEGYLEVETPLLNSHASGALARPFKTHANELSKSYFYKQLTVYFRK